MQRPPSCDRTPRRGRRVSTSLSEINVVPLVDVMLVLLIIFMVTAPMIQRGIDVNLPVARGRRRSRASGCLSRCRRLSAETSVVYIGDEADPRRRAAGAHPPADGDGTDKQVYLRGDGGVLLSGSDGCVRPLEGRRRREESASSRSCRGGALDRWIAQVTDVTDSSRSDAGARRPAEMVVVSVTCIMVLVAAIVFAPGGWFSAA